MKKIKKKLIYFIILLFVILTFFGIYLISQDTNNKLSKKIKDNVPLEIKQLLKNTIFYIPLKIREFKDIKRENEKLKVDINTLDYENIYLKNKLEFGKFNEKIINSKNSKYNLKEFILPFYTDENLFDNDKKGFLEIYKNKLIIFFGSGKSILVDTNELKKNNLTHKNVKNNIISNGYFDTKIKWAGVKDIKVDGENIYLSLSKAVLPGCYNTSIYSGKIDLENFGFNEILLEEKCAKINSNFAAHPSFKNFNGYQNGGRIIIDEKNIYLTIGDYNQWDLVQKEDNLFGKIIKINKSNLEFKIISKGHRNQQGMFNLNNSRFIITEHGPKGGDELNLIETDNPQILNFGWPISSYGDHYDSVPLSKNIKKIAPLNKSHKKYGFIEPIFYFDKGIGISEIIKNYYTDDNSFFVTYLKNKTIYNIKFDENFENPIVIDEIKIGERIRDIIFDINSNSYYLYLEESPKLSILTLIKD